jgi:hypothetical protein
VLQADKSARVKEIRESVNMDRSFAMCEGFEWLEWQRELERQATKRQTDKLTKESKKEAAPKPAEPEKQEEPVPV